MEKLEELKSNAKDVDVRRRLVRIWWVSGHFSFDLNIILSHIPCVTDCVVVSGRGEENFILCQKYSKSSTVCGYTESVFSYRNENSEGIFATINGHHCRFGL